MFDFSRKQDDLGGPVNISGCDIDVVTSYKYLGVLVDEKLNWGEQCKDVLAKGHARLHYLRKLKSFNIDTTIMRLFYASVVESAVLYGCLSWYGSLRKGDEMKIQRLLNQASKVLKQQISLNEICSDKVIKKVESLLNDNHHPLAQYYCLMRSGKRLQSLRCRTSRFLNSFVQFSVRLSNNK